MSMKILWVSSTYIRDYAGNNLSNCSGCSYIRDSTHHSWPKKTGSNNVDKSLSNATGGSFEIDGLNPADFSRAQLRQWEVLLFQIIGIIPTLCQYNCSGSK